MVTSIHLNYLQTYYRKKQVATPSSETEVYNLRLLPGATAVWRAALPGKIAQTAPWLVNPQHGIKTVVDLREPSEQRQYPDYLPVHITHVSVPLYDAEIPRLTSLETVYKQLLQQRSANIAAACNAIITGAARGVLFHCTAGKDRTGLIAALLLRAAGCPESIIAADYEQSARSLPQSFHRQALAEIALYAAPESAAYKAAAQLHTESPASVLLRTLRRLEMQEGSVSAYLARAGVAAENLSELPKIFAVHSGEVVDV